MDFIKIKIEFISEVVMPKISKSLSFVKFRLFRLRSQNKKTTYESFEKLSTVLTKFGIQLVRLP